MKKSIYCFIMKLIVGIVLISGLCAYAVDAVIDSKQVSYDNTKSKGSYKNVQDSIDELYKKAKELNKETDTLYKDPILNGADPVLGKDMIPVTIDDEGVVKYANLFSKWYEYETKNWANAVILVDGAKDKYKMRDVIDEKDIESYFVWIPRYKYKLWDLGNYKGYYSLSQLHDSKERTDTSITYLSGDKVSLIDIVFEDKDAVASTTQEVGKYYTHPAFTLGDKKLNGLWIAKFVTGGSESGIKIKSNITSWRSATLGTFWHSLYDYKRDLDSHMMKNTEWGAVAYLSHSIYGIGTEVNINNNSEYKTGFSATANSNQSVIPGEVGNANDKTMPYNTPTGYLASTTGNISGIYDMSGAAQELAAYVDGYGVKSSREVNSGLTDNDLSVYAKYFDKYPTDSETIYFNYRILGDATGELGPFYIFNDDGFGSQVHSAWYASFGTFIGKELPWFSRGALNNYGWITGQFAFSRASGGADSNATCRLVLAVN